MGGAVGDGRGSGGLEGKCSAENNYLVMLGHMSKQTQLWSDTQILWSDVIFQ